MDATTKPTVTHNPTVFDVRSVEEARRIVLTPEGGQTSEERETKETPYLVDLLTKHAHIYPDSIVLDYGCGYGRLSKELIKRYNCWVIGVDTSPSMRGLATSYVRSNHFIACAPEALQAFSFPEADLAISVWTLQHCLNVQDDIYLIHHCLKLQGSLFVVNNNQRVVPTFEYLWADDGISVQQILHDTFKRSTTGILDPAIVTEEMSKLTFWGVYDR